MNYVGSVICVERCKGVAWWHASLLQLMTVSHCAPLCLRISWYVSRSCALLIHSYVLDVSWRSWGVHECRFNMAMPHPPSRRQGDMRFCWLISCFGASFCAQDSYVLDSLNHAQYLQLVVSYQFYSLVLFLVFIKHLWCHFFFLGHAHKLLFFWYLLIWVWGW